MIQICEAMKNTNIRTIGLLTIAYASACLANSDIADDLQKELIQEEIIVTADRSEAKVKDTGSSVSVLTETDIENTQAVFATQLLRHVPGISVSHSGPIGGASQIRIRGSEGNHTLVLIDGISVNDPAIGSEFNFADLMLGDAAQIEIVRGPQTTLYGSDAIGGVINIRTQTPKNQGLHGRIGFDTGNKDTNLQAIKLGARGDNSYGILNFEKYSTNGTNASLLGAEQDGYSTQNMLFKYGADLSSSLNTTLFVRRTNNHSQTDPQDFNYPATETQGLVIDGNEHSKTWQEHRGLSLNYQSTDKPINSVIRMQSTRTQSQFFQEEDYALGNQGARDKLDWYSTIEFNDKEVRHRLGLLLIHENLNFMNYSKDYQAANYRESLNQSSIAALYHLSPSTNTHFNFSGRRDHNSRFEDASSFRASLSHLFRNGNTRLHTSLGTGSTNPSFIEIFGYAPSNFEGNTNLEPERSVSLDLGLEHSFYNRNIMVDLTAFSANLRDEIITVFDPQTFKSKSINDDQKSTRTGIELSAATYLQKNWSLATTYTHLTTEDGYDVEEIRRPKHKGSISLNYRFNNSKTHINIGAIFHGEQKDLEFIASTQETTVTLPAYRLINLAINHEITEKLTTRLTVHNLLDSEYSEIFSYRSPSRSIVVGLKYEF